MAACDVRDRTSRPPRHRSVRAIRVASPIGAVRGPVERSTLGAAVATIAVAASTGLGAQTGIIDTTSVRWVHHALYGASVSTVALALLIVRGRRRRTALLAATAALVGLSRTRGGTPTHAATAAVALACCVAATPTG